MSNAGVLYLTIALMLLTAAVTHTIDNKICSGDDAKNTVVQQQITIGALGHEVKQISQQSAINQGAEDAHKKDVTDIGTLYHAPLMQQPAIATNVRVRPFPAAACKPQTSEKFKLTPEECDDEEDGYNKLWDDWKSQAEIK